MTHTDILDTVVTCTDGSKHELSRIVSAHYTSVGGRPDYAHARCILGGYRIDELEFETPNDGGAIYATDIAIELWYTEEE